MTEETVEVVLAKHDGRITALERTTKQHEERNKVISDLRVEIGKLQMQIKITWVLLMMVISGLVGVAFSIWKGSVP